VLSKNFEVTRIIEVKDLVALGKELQNVASLEAPATNYLAEGRIYVAKKLPNPEINMERLLDDKILKYMIYVKDNKLAGGPYFSTYKIEFVGKEDAKEITQLLLDEKEIELDLVAQNYLDGK